MIGEIYGYILCTAGSHAKEAVVAEADDYSLPFCFRGDFEIDRSRLGHRWLYPVQINHSWIYVLSVVFSAVPEEFHVNLGRKRVGTPIEIFDRKIYSDKDASFIGFFVGNGGKENLACVANLININPPIIPR